MVDIYTEKEKRIQNWLHGIMILYKKLALYGGCSNSYNDVAN